MTKELSEAQKITAMWKGEFENSTRKTPVSFWLFILSMATAFVLMILCKIVGDKILDADLTSFSAYTIFVIAAIVTLIPNLLQLPRYVLLYRKFSKQVLYNAMKA